jgi:anti-anti-sigma regulatory factor
MLQIASEHETTPDGKSVAVMRLSGELDAASFGDVIEHARQLIGAGAQGLLLDMTELAYMGSSGIFALHSIAMLVQGESPPDPEQGWAALHDAGPSSEFVEQLKILSPQPQVDRVLERTGMKRFFEVHPDRTQAIASF